MKSEDKFEEVKIKMVMKLKKLSRGAAIKEIADKAAGHASMRIHRDNEIELVSAEEFFGED